MCGVAKQRPKQKVQEHVSCWQGGRNEQEQELEHEQLRREKQSDNGCFHPSCSIPFVILCPLFSQQSQPCTNVVVAIKSTTMAAVMHWGWSRFISVDLRKKLHATKNNTLSHSLTHTTTNTHTHTHTINHSSPSGRLCVDVCGVDAEKHKAKQKQKKKLQMIGLGRGVVRISNDVRQLSCIESLRVLFVLKTGQKRKEKQGPKNAPGSTWRKRAKSMTRTKQ